MNLNKSKGWHLRYTPGNSAVDSKIDDIAIKLGLSPAIARLLYNRGYTESGVADAFLNVSLSALHDPYEMKDMRDAVMRISRAIEQGEKITIYGDYDVDGVTSVTLLYTYLSALGADVNYYIPIRAKDGYGLSMSAIDQLKQSGTEFMITVDTGITAAKEAEYAKELGIEMVVTDHHECHGDLPSVCAVVNPHRPDCPYPFKELAGVGVVFKLICAYEMMRMPELSANECTERICSEYIDLVAMGTVADVMPLSDENRYIVKRGLEYIEDTDRVGLAALIEAATRPTVAVDKQPAKKRRINSGFISFSLAPRINAAGRMSSASKAVDLLLEKDEDTAFQMAEELCEINGERQRQENKIAEKAYAMIEEMCDLKNDRVIVLDNDKWQQGIIGIVSSRITEKYGLPSILISFDGSVDGEPAYNDIGKGSGRSIKGMNLVEALDYCSDLLVQFGGHELAAGLSVQRCNIEEFRNRINEYAKDKLSEDDLRISIEADCEILPDEIDLATAEDIARLEPFGVANPTPTFIIRDLTIDKLISMGAGKHTKLLLSQGEQSFSAVYFGMPIPLFGFYTGERVDVLCQIAVNEFRGKSTVQLVVQDIKLTDKLSKQYEIDRSEYKKLNSGEHFAARKDIIPTRAQIVDIYKFLRCENMCGRTLFNHRALRSQFIDHQGGFIDGLKLRIMVKILADINVCNLDEQSNDDFYLEVCKNAAKTNIEESATYKRIVSMVADQ